MTFLTRSEQKDGKHTFIISPYCLASVTPYARDPRILWALFVHRPRLDHSQVLFVDEHHEKIRIGKGVRCLRGERQGDVTQLLR